MAEENKQINNNGIPAISSSAWLGTDEHKVWTREEWMEAIETSHAEILRAAQALRDLIAICNDPTHENQEEDLGCADKE